MSGPRAMWIETTFSDPLFENLPMHYAHVAIKGAHGEYFQPRGKFQLFVEHSAYELAIKELRARDAECDEATFQVAKLKAELKTAQENYQALARATGNVGLDE